MFFCFHFLSDTHLYPCPTSMWGLGETYDFTHTFILQVRVTSFGYKAKCEFVFLLSHLIKFVSCLTLCPFYQVRDELRKETQQLASKFLELFETYFWSGWVVYGHWRDWYQFVVDYIGKNLEKEPRIMELRNQVSF